MEIMKTLGAVLLCVMAWSASAQSPTNTVGGGPGTPHSRIIAGPFTNLANGHFYYLLASTTWSNSEALAVSYGGHLATVRDADENQWLVDTFAHYGGVIRPLWIGLTDRDNEGTFEWVSGEPLTYTRWNTRTSEPNNSGGGGYEEDFGYIAEEFAGYPTDLVPGFWNDVPNNGYGMIHAPHGVLETTALITPTPSVVPPPVARVRVGCVDVCFLSMTNAQYQVQYRSANVSNTNWVNVGAPLLGNGGQICVSDEPHGSNRVYRVAVLP